MDFGEKLLQGLQGDPNTTSIVPRQQTILPKIDASSLKLPKTGGLGSFAALKAADGTVTGISEDAFNAIQDSGGVAAMGDGFSLDKIGTDNSGSNFKFGIGDAIGIGQLGLGYLNYKDTKKYNAKAIEAMDENIAGARAERKATENYRASYGA